MMDMGDEFEEFETTEDEIDAMMAAGEPVEVDVPGDRYVDTLYVRTGVPLTRGGSTLMPNVAVLSVRIAMPVSHSAETAA
jgi:hypothetical protein